MKAHRVSRGTAPPILTWATDGGERLTSRFTSGKDPGTHWIGRWVGHRPGVDFWRREKSLAPVRIRNLDHPVHNLVCTWRGVMSNYTDLNGKYYVRFGTMFVKSKWSEPGHASRQNIWISKMFNMCLRCGAFTTNKYVKAQRGVQPWNSWDVVIMIVDP